MHVALTVNDFLDRAAHVYGSRLGIVDEPDQPAESWGSITYAEMARRARAQAAALDAMGLDRGARVAIVSHNSARLMTAFFGVSGWGRVLVPVNFRLGADEISYIVEHCGAEVLLVDPELDDALAAVTAKQKLVLGSESDQDLYRFDTEPEPWEADEDATATINYTSGTTARPKGVELAHRTIWLNATIFGWQAGVNDRDVYLHTLPMFHCNGWGMPYGVTGMGGRHIVLRKVDGAEILRRVEQHGVTLLNGAPAVVAAILDAASTWDGEVPGRGRTRMIVAGAPPPTRTIERVETELGWEFIQIYGLTETAPLLTMNRGREEYDALSPSERASRLGRAGAPSLGTRVSVDAEGEVLAASNVVMRGYWEQPEATATALDGGWFHTGDGGYLDDDGYLTIADRKKDVIISGGENVSSIEVEDAVFSHPSVAEVAVIGVPDEKWGETVIALVVIAPGCEVSEREIIDHCRERLAHYKCPTAVEFRAELARTATGKLQKFKLRAPYWEGRDRLVNQLVPEGDTIHRAAQQLRAALAGKRLVKLEVRRDPRGRRGPEPGVIVSEVVAQGKHLLIRFDDGHVLHTHMQLTGVWQVYRPGERWRRPGHTARVVLEVEGGTTAVCFAAPLVELRKEGGVRAERTPAAARVDALGPDLCTADPDLDIVMERLARLEPETTVAVALLDQHIAAGIGNVYKSEVCWAERVSPFAPLTALDAATRRRVYETAHRQLRANLGSGRRVTYQGGLAVYGRAGRPCFRCRTRIASRGGRNDERVTYWCPTCQPAP